MFSLIAYNRGRQDYLERRLVNPYWPQSPNAARDWSNGVEDERQDFDDLRREMKS